MKKNQNTLYYIGKGKVKTTVTADGARKER